MNNNQKYVYTYIISHIYINIYRTIFFFFCIQVLKTSMEYVSVLYAMKNK